LGPTMSDEIKENTFEYVHYTMHHEGFDYAFCNYSQFKKVKDKKFHELRKAYIEAQEKLEEYVLSKSNLDEDLL